MSAFAAAGLRTSLLRGCNLLLMGMRECIGSEAISVDFSNGNILAELNGIYTNNEIKNMPEGNDFDQRDSMLQFAAAFLDKAMGKEHSHPMRHVYTSFSELRNLLNHEK